MVAVRDRRGLIESETSHPVVGSRGAAMTVAVFAGDRHWGRLYAELRSVIEPSRRGRGSGGVDDR